MKPMIATDTGEPLVVFGYALAEGGRLMPQVIDAHRPKPLPTERDLALYRAHGMQGLEAMGYAGVIDRIQT